MSFDSRDHGPVPAVARAHAPRASPQALAALRGGDAVAEGTRRERRLATILHDRGLVSEAELAAARAAQAAVIPRLPLGHILRARGLVSEAELLSAQSELYGTGLVDLDSQPPDAALAGILGAHLALDLEAVVWRRAGPALVVATARPDRSADLAAALPRGMRLIVVLAGRAQILTAQTRLYGTDLAREAEARAPERLSCRTWQPRDRARLALCLGVPVAAGLLFVPLAVVVLLYALAIGNLLTSALLKATALAAVLRDRRAGAAPDRDAGLPAPPRPRPLHHSVVSLLVPLFREGPVAARLVERLDRLDYPPERLDILLIVEEADTETAEALRRAKLPPHMRLLIVPPGDPRTKPRALNYALNFARGDIIGIYDAEDRPERDQIDRVVQRFAELPADVACLQGRLDYYNSRHNLMARFFTVEYAAWFRVLLPGVQRMGLFVPLGGTTVFLKRRVLDEVGAWDAHNVTEDAELGLRLARMGYRTEIVETTTFEEAAAAAWPWIRQRSRWLKGYLVTWAAAMRTPLSLWRELGPRAFLGMQVQVAGAVLGFLLAPFLWTFVLVPFGAAHPLDPVIGPVGYAVIGVLMVCSLCLSIAVGHIACGARHLRRHRVIAPFVGLYLALAVVAAWIALAGLLLRPSFWAKTAHGPYGALVRRRNRRATRRRAAGTAPAPGTPTPAARRLSGALLGGHHSAAPASSFRRTTNAIDK